MIRAISSDQDRMEAFVAELTLAAYRVALQTETRGGSWIDLHWASGGRWPTR